MTPSESRPREAFEPVRDRRLPLPHSDEAEAALLGAVMYLRDPLRKIAAMAVWFSSPLEPADFYDWRHRIIYEAMCSLDARGKPWIDIVTVSEELSEQHQLEMVGGVAYLNRLVVSVPEMGSLPRYVEIVRELALLRRLLATTYEMQDRASEADR